MRSGKVHITNWEPWRYLTTKKMIKEYLKAVFELGSPDVLMLAIGDIAKARGGVTQFAKEVGLTRQAIYKIIKGESEPTFTTLQKILNFFNLKLNIG